MNFESVNKYQAMDFLELEADAVASPILQECALEYLKSEDGEYFNREFTGEVDKDGYLIPKKNGIAHTKPCQNIAGDAMKWVADLAKMRLQGAI